MDTKILRISLLLLPLFLPLTPAQAGPIQDLTFTDVIKEVVIIDPATKKETPAKVGDKLVPPNVLKTGADSRAELVAEDKTVTRVGSNTIFSVEANSRDVNLAQGSVLFHAPSGRGGGRIKSAGATASVLGTTLTVSANAAGGFKTSLLEGKGEVKDPKGGKVNLAAGQVTFAKPGGGLSAALNFDLKAQVANSKLVGGFSKPLASLAKIEAAIAAQQAKIASGGLASTGLLLGDRPDMAFKIDLATLAAIAELVKRKQLDQIAADKETQTFYEVDPRFLAAVATNLEITTRPETEASNSSTGTPQSNDAGGTAPTQQTKTAYSVATDGNRPISTVPESLVFLLDGSGLANMDAFGVAGVPKTVPGNRSQAGIVSALIVPNITLSDPTATAGTETPVNNSSQGAGSTNSADTSAQTLTQQTLSNAKIIAKAVGAPVTDATTVPEVELKLVLASGSTLPSWLKPGVTLNAEALPESLLGARIQSVRENGEIILSQSTVMHEWLDDLRSGKEVTVVPEGNLSFSLYPAGVLHSTVVDKTATAFVALNTIQINGNFELIGQEKTELAPDGSEVGHPLLISAGNTLKMTPGSVLHANTSLLEIFTAGTSFAPDLTLSTLPLKEGESPTPLRLAQVGILNQYPLDSTTQSQSTIRIKAPSIDFTDVLLLSASESSEVALEASGDIAIQASASAPSKAPHSLLNLGFADLKDLCIRAFKVSITSSGKSISLTGTNLFANQIRLDAETGEAIRLSGVTIDTYDFSRDQTLEAVSKGDLTIVGLRNLKDGEIPDDTVKTMPAAKKTSLSSKAGKVALLGVEFGSPGAVSENGAIESEFTAKAALAVELTKAAVYADNVLFEGESVLVKGVSIEPTSTDLSELTMTAQKGDLRMLALEKDGVQTFNLVKAYKISLSSANDLVIEDTVFSAPSSSKGNTFDAKAAADLSLKNVALSDAKNVALQARTIVLQDVAFGANAKVDLTSREGLMSTPARGTTVTPGWINVYPNVTYPSADPTRPFDLNTLNAPAAGFNNAQFHEAAKTKFGSSLDNITLKGSAK